MTKNGVCAVFTSYRPPAEVPENLAKARPLMEQMVVVDNGSPDDKLEPVRRASREHEFILIENGANLGIGAALNIGVRWAKSHGYKFVVLFDQDSEVSEGLVSTMLREYEAHPLREKIAIVTPKHVEFETGVWHPPVYAKDGNPLTAITSGSFIPVEIFDRCGYFEEDLIMDRHDDEFALRVRSFGYTIFLCMNAVLNHSIGTPRMHSFLGLRQVRARHYSIPRQYYLTRAQIVIVKRYWRQYPRWICGTVREMVYDTVVNFVVEERRWTKLMVTIRGVFDGFRGKLGKVVPI